MKYRIKKILGWLFLSLMVLFAVSGCADTRSPAPTATQQTLSIDEHGTYISKEEVALYLHTYNRLPDNFVTKKEAEDQGWNSKEGDLQDILPGKSIGGSHFGNYDKQLPEKKGRRYFECDLNYTGGYRGAERLVYSNDGLIFYTGDHYETFEQLY